ncbi:MAG: hypothetical protein A2W19_08855 [Spirochaetes bacterium RBG_16_49_21]|nr:MAG: hypothetical protein A2W19_08855 [Spirochaetes bacterium RBG_16_49_21]
MRVLFFSIILTVSICLNAAVQESPEQVREEPYSPLRGAYLIDSPTAYTIDRASYNFNIFIYNQGGIQLKSFIGLHDNIYFGVSFNMKDALGNDPPRPDIPAVVVKIKLVDGIPYIPAIAVGYDSFYEGTNQYLDNASSFYNRVMNGSYFFYINPLVYYYRKNMKKDLYYNVKNRMFSGPYLVFTSPLYLFRSEQYFIYGVRMPVQPHVRPDDTSYFFGLDIPLGDFFRIKGEVERVFWNLRKPDEWFFNCAARVTFFDQLGLEFGLIIEPGERINRILKIEYHGEF